MQILPGVYQLNGSFCGQTQNGYLIRTEHVAIVIDSGEMEWDIYGLIERNAARWGIDLADVDYMLLTHAHYDHSSHAARLQRLGARLIGNQDCADALASGDERCIAHTTHRPFETCQIDRIVSDGETLQLGELTIDCLEVPGHTASCVAYRVHLGGETLLFVGDVITIGEHALTASTGWTGSLDYDRRTYLTSLRRLAHLDSDHLFSGHGPVCLGRGRTMCEMAYTQAMMDWIDAR